MTNMHQDTGTSSTRGSTSLRLVWPQWQGAGGENVGKLVPELPFEDARLGYAIGSAVLDAVLPRHDGPTATVPVDLGLAELDERDGVEAKDAVLRQLAVALDIIDRHDPGRILTLGGDCAVSVGPFSKLAARYGDDLAVVWVDAHPDVGTPASEYGGYHAMALAALTGHGDPDVLGLLPATVAPRRVAVAGLHSWTDGDYPNIAAWGITAFAPDDLRKSSRRLLEWLAGTGCSRVAIHFDVDVVDSNDVVLGLAAAPGGLSGQQARRVVEDIGSVADVVGLTIAEFMPRQVMRLMGMLRGLPLIGEDSRTGSTKG